MKNSKRIFALLILFVSVLIFSMLTVTAAEVSKQQKNINDGSIQIEANYKKITTFKVTFKANGGKIGAKTKVSTKITKGAKINNFPTSPKRTGYKFKGWYSKKSGGKKISLKFKPTKKVTFYAHWTRSLTATEKKLVGTWNCYDTGDSYKFTNKGKFKYTNYLDSKTGDFKVSDGQITFSKITWKYGTTKYTNKYPKTVADYKVEKSPKMLYMKIKSLTYPDLDYLLLSNYKIYSKAV
ncbi:MAG: InlB B-repeat-containing protein [Methanobrevibacter sp.]|nr:InlB B-repeat-containing protein [Methanobrevibacter sp.]